MFHHEYNVKRDVISADLTLTQGKVMSNFGIYDFVKLTRITAETLVLTASEFKWLLAMLSRQPFSDARLALQTKMIYLQAPSCICGKWKINNDYQLRKEKMDVTAEERLNLFAIMKIEEPKQIMFETERLSTFDNWSVNFISKEDMAKAGFFYADDGDKVTCFYCKGELNNWKEGDNPAKMHKKYFPFCAFAKCIPVDKNEECKFPQEFVDR